MSHLPPPAATTEPTIVVVVGTRPEVVKMIPVVDALAARGARVQVVHSGQHYSPSLAADFHADLDWRPEVQLEATGGGRTDQLGHITRALGARWTITRPSAVLVQGDTTTALAGALAATACDVPVVHVEAGLRSDDRAMPEEHHRIVVDHLSALACAPTEVAAERLRAELDPSRAVDVVVTGNPVIDALLARRPDAAAIATATRRHGVGPDGYVLATMHRPENVDDPVRLERWLAALAAASLPVLLPLHPRTRARLGADPGGAVQLLEPLHHGEFLALLAGCAVAVSDSGGIQEEVSVLGRRVLVARRSTERPEGLGTFAHLVTDPDDLVGLLHDELVNPAAAHARLAAVASPYGDGHAGERIAEAVLSRWG